MSVLELTALLATRVWRPPRAFLRPGPLLKMDSSMPKPCPVTQQSSKMNWQAIVHRCITAREKESDDIIRKLMEGIHSSFSSESCCWSSLLGRPREHTPPPCAAQHSQVSTTQFDPNESLFTSLLGDKKVACRWHLWCRSPDLILQGKEDYHI